MELYLVGPAKGNHERNREQAKPASETANQVKANLKNTCGRAAELPHGLQLCRSD